MTDDPQHKTTRPLVTSDPQIQGGAPCIRGTRIPVRALRAFAAAGCSAEEIAREYPPLTVEQVREVLADA